MEQSATSRRPAPSSNSSRDRSISMNHCAEIPPAKKHRASDDDESDTNGVSSTLAPPPPTKVCVGQKASSTSPQNWKEQATNAANSSMHRPSAGEGSHHSHSEAGIAGGAGDADGAHGGGETTGDQSPSSASSKSSLSSAGSSSSFSSSPRSKPLPGSDGERGMTEDSFLSWLLDQKQQGVPAGQMLDVLGLGVSEGIAVDDDELWEAMLSMGIRLIQPTIASRQKLDHVNTLQDVVDLLQRAKKIVVLAGAGISVSCGIPDFRSENGIYSRLSEYNLPNPQCMFDIEFFRTNPRPFFAFAKELFPKSNGFTFVPSRSHYFLKLLEDKGKLLRVYSQNIDMLEHAAGISHDRSILCHGSFATATCLSCKKVYPGDAIREDVMKQQVPMCEACGAESGIVKPDIVFFGEALPRRFHDLIKADENEADLVLVMGSSLKVNPVRSLVGRIHQNAPMILINREPVGRPHKFDVELLGYSDEIVEELCRMLGWELPQPDPVLLGQSNLTFDHQGASKTKAPLPFDFVPPCRHMFSGAKASSPSSSDDEDLGESRSNADEENGFGRALDVGMEDADGQAISRIGDEDEDHDHLMGSGSELLRHSAFEEDMNTEDGDM